MKVWVAELAITRNGFSGTWLTVHSTPDRARLTIAERADMYGVADLHERAITQAEATGDDVLSSAAVTEGLREIAWTINRHTVD